VIPFFAFPVAVRRITYTTNAIEALNAKLRRAVQTRGHFPTDEASTKLLYLVLRQMAGEWKMPSREWSQAKTKFAIMFDGRFVNAGWAIRLHTQNSRQSPIRLMLRKLCKTA
jgi:putative transposase